MKKIKVKYIFFLVLLISFQNILAQTTGPNLEFSQGGMSPILNGPLKSVTVNFTRNTNNPTGNSFAAYSTTPLSATFTLSNHQYDDGDPNSPTGTVFFGYAGKVSSATLIPLGSFGGAYTTTDFLTTQSTSGGLNVGNTTTDNYMLSIQSVVDPLNGKIQAARYYLEDLEIKFNRPVNNPILHLGGMGAAISTVNFYTTEFDLLSSDVPVTLSKLAGSTSLAVQTVGGVTQIVNTATTPAASGASSGKGSILINGTNITTIKLKVYVRGTGSGSTWVNGAINADTFEMGFSAEESDL